jgi:iron complex transport system ATP-binding protein
MTPALIARNLRHAYGTQTVLRDLSFEVRKGEFFIIIGPNGSGKTTLLKILAGIDRSFQGSVALLQRPLKSYTRRELARRLALVPQLAAETFPFSVQEVLLMGRAPHMGLLGLESQKDRRIAEQAMRFTGVSHLGRRRLDQLSGGERQRVYLARAVCQEPAVILLDEPTAALDLAHQIRVMDLMARLREERGVTIVMVSHDINLAAMYADRLMLLKDGTRVAIGSPREIVTYQNIERTYGCRVLVGENPLGGYPQVTPVPGRFLQDAGGPADLDPGGE